MIIQMDSGAVGIMLLFPMAMIMIAVIVWIGEGFHRFLSIGVSYYSVEYRNIKDHRK